MPPTYDPPALPAFPLGYPVRFGYLGLYRPHEQPTDREGRPVPGEYRVWGFQLSPLGPADGAPARVRYVNGGWGYIIGPADPAADRWSYKTAVYTEAELRAKGYDPADPAPWLRPDAPTPAGTCDRCGAKVPGLALSGDVCRPCGAALAKYLNTDAGGEG